MPAAAPLLAAPHPLVEAARRYAGMREGNPAIPFATASKPWCAIFAATILRDCGVPVPDRPEAWSVTWLMSWLDRRGCGLGHRGELQPGDVIATTRRGGKHIGILTADEGGQWIGLISGNTWRKGKRGVVWVDEHPIRRATVIGAARVIGG